MTSCFRRSLAASCGVFFSTLALAANVGPLDPGFGDGGLRNYGFQPVAGVPHDSARAGCPGPGNTFIVIGAASGGRRIVTLRLKPDGSLDPGFSEEGKESFDFIADYASHAPAVCLPQGDAVIANIVTTPSGEQNLRLVRVGRDTGLPVAGFGIGGVVDLDLDQHIAGLGMAEVPIGLNVLGNGDLVITGYVTTSSQSIAGFAALLDAAGQVRAAKIVDCYMTSAAMDASQGALWVFGIFDSRACRLTLDRNTLVRNDRLLGPATTAQWPGAARLVRGDTVAMATTTIAPNGGSGLRAALQVFRGDTVASMALPMPAASPSTSLLSGGTSYPGVQILPGGRVLYGTTATDMGSGAANGMYLALVRIGRDAAGDALETAFGGGVRLARWQPDTPNCSAAAPPQWIVRMTQWLGRPAFVGKADAACLGTGAGEDYLVGRIETNYLFADGFD